MRHAEYLLKTGQARDGADIHHILLPNISGATVHRQLRGYGLKGRICAPKPLLMNRHKRGWRELVKIFRDWSAEDWDAVLFSNESKFALFGSDGRIYCRRRDGEHYQDQ